MPKKTFIPLVKSGGYLPSNDYTPLIYPRGKTTLDAKDDDQNDEKEDSQDASDLH